jgi:hypothetical protein
MNGLWGCLENVFHCIHTPLFAALGLRGAGLLVGVF